MAETPRRPSALDGPTTAELEARLDDNQARAARIEQEQRDLRRELLDIHDDDEGAHAALAARRLARQSADAGDQQRRPDDDDDDEPMDQGRGGETERDAQLESAPTVGAAAPPPRGRAASVATVDGASSRASSPRAVSRSRSPRATGIKNYSAAASAMAKRAENVLSTKVRQLRVRRGGSVEPTPALYVQDSGVPVFEWVQDVQGIELDAEGYWATWGNSEARKGFFGRIDDARRAERAAATLECDLCLSCAAPTKDADGGVLAGAIECSSVWCRQTQCLSCVAESSAPTVGAAWRWTCGCCPMGVVVPADAELPLQDGVPDLLAAWRPSAAFRDVLYAEETDVGALVSFMEKELPFIQPPDGFSLRRLDHVDILVRRIRTWADAGRRLGVAERGASYWRVERLVAKYARGVSAEVAKLDEDCKRVAAASRAAPSCCESCALMDTLLLEALEEQDGKESPPDGEGPAAAALAKGVADALRPLLPIVGDEDFEPDSDDEPEDETSPGEGPLDADHIKYWPVLRMWACKFCNQRILFIFDTFPNARAVLKLAVQAAYCSLVNANSAR